MKVSHVVKETIKVGGTIAKVGVEIGADAIGILAEKVDNNPEDKEKFVTGGKEIGQKIKASTNKVAEDSVEVVDDIVETGKEMFNDISNKVKEKTCKYSKKNDDKEPSNQANKTKNKSGRTYITIESTTESD